MPKNQRKPHHLGMPTQNQEMFEKNMNVVRVITSTIILCDKQNIPLRGNRDDSTSTASVNKSNFHAILIPIRNSDKDLKEHFLPGRGNATSTSKTGQEEVIRIIGAYIRSKVTQPIQKENAFFSIIGDEVTDKYANQEVLSVCLKVLRSKK